MLELDTDCANPVRKLTNREMDRSIHGPRVEDVKALLHGLDDLKVKHVGLAAKSHR
jgi:hypothetical protein